MCSALIAYAAGLAHQLAARSLGRLPHPDHGAVHPIRSLNARISWFLSQRLRELEQAVPSPV